MMSQAPQLPDQGPEHRDQPVVVVHPLSSDQRVISNGISQQVNTGSVSREQTVEPQPVTRTQVATVRSIPPGDRLIGVTMQ